jgi:acyl carrier protein
MDQDTVYSSKAGDRPGAPVTRGEVYDRIASLLEEIAEIPKKSVSETSTIDHDLSMQSVAFVELQVALEDEYDIEIDPIHIVELNEFGQIVDYVHELAVTSPGTSTQ